jgi:DNA processing protein
VAHLVQLTPLDAGYPARLRCLGAAPSRITVRGGELEAWRTVAIVGSRRALPEARAFAERLAAQLAAAGAVVVSGGALGIDAAAHEGALGVDGRTWAVSPTGHDHCFPPQHTELFARIGRGPGAMIWPFAPGFRHRTGFHERNRVLVALSDAVVVGQAGLQSGALHAAGWARKLGKPLWVVPAAPWTHGFEGSLELIASGARVLRSARGLLESLGLASRNEQRRASTAPSSSLSPTSATVLAALGESASHIDAVALRAQLPAQLTASTLLTLALEDVVVEGPPGFFRRRDAR